MVAHIAYADGGQRSGTLTVHFVPTPALRLGDLLLAEEPVVELQSAARRYPVSVVSVGDPYVFIDAVGLGVRTQRALFADDRQLDDTLAALRTAAARRLRLPQEGVFPKIVAIGRFHRGRLAVRAISIPGSPPTLALTGAICLGVASTLKETIPYQLTRPARCVPATLTIDTPQALTAVTVRVTGRTPDEHLLSTSVTRTRPPNRCRTRWSQARHSRRHHNSIRPSERLTMPTSPAI